MRCKRHCNIVVKLLDCRGVLSNPRATHGLFLSLDERVRVTENAEAILPDALRPDENAPFPTKWVFSGAVVIRGYFSGWAVAAVRVSELAPACSVTACSQTMGWPLIGAEITRW
jgi:hypothetical protein